MSLDRKFRSPARTVPRQQDGRVEALEIADGALDLGVVTRGEMIAANDGMKRNGIAQQPARMSGGVDDAGVAASGEHDDAFA